MAVNSSSMVARQIANPAGNARSAWLPYACAIVVTILALLARMLLAPYIGPQFPFATVYFAVTLMAWYGGWRPALLSTVLGYFGAAYFFIVPYHSFVIHGLANYIGAGIYFFISFSSSLFSEAQHRAQTRAETSLQQARAQEKAVRESEARKAAMLENALDAIITMDHNGNITEFNPAAERIFGYRRSDAIGKEMAQLLIPPALRESHRTGLAHYLATGEGVVLNNRIEIMALHANGTEFPVELAITRIPGEGLPAFFGNIRDITVRKKAELQQNFLAEASGLLASSLDYQTTLQRVAHLIVPEFADWCIIHLVDKAGGLEMVGVAHTDPVKEEAAREISRRYPPRPDTPHGAYAVVRSGKSEWSPEITADMLRAAAQDEEHYRLLMEAGIKSYLCVPLVTRGRSLGAITLVGAETAHPYNPEDAAFMEELARRAASAVDNALLYKAERDYREQLSLAISEVHHRVKNNLQAVAALLEMQMPETGEVMPLEAVRDSLGQIKTIALVHDLLARDKPIATVDVAQVLARLAALLASSMTMGAQSVHVEAESVQMDTQNATALALIANELVTNAAKHNEAEKPGEIVIRFHEGTGNKAILNVQDTGPGFPPDFNPVRDANIGLQTVMTLVRHDLRGTVYFGNWSDAEAPERHGASVEITFPLPAAAA